MHLETINPVVSERRIKKARQLVRNIPQHAEIDCLNVIYHSLMLLRVKVDHVGEQSLISASASTSAEKPKRASGDQGTA